MKKEDTNILNRWWTFRKKVFLQSLIVGLVSGAVVIAYRFFVEKADTIRNIIYIFLKNNSFIYTILWIVIVLIIGIILGLILKKEPLSGGSGIPQVKGMLLYHLELKWLRVFAAKFIGGILAIFTGMSLGREGPSIQLGALSGEAVNSLFIRDKLHQKYLITAGSSAGLAAAFNAPLAGIIFSLEELHKNISPYVLLSSAIASLTANFMSQNIFGREPVFSFKNMEVLPFQSYFFLILLGIIMGILGTLFNLSIVGTSKLYDKIKFIPKIFFPIIPMFFTIICGFFLPEGLGGGHNLIDSLVVINYGIVLLIILFFSKFILTMVSYGSGVPGGIFLPLLCIGALFGDIYGNLLFNLGQIESSNVKNFIALAMSAYFTAIVKAPITGSILITEMTGSLAHLFPLMTVSMIAYLTSDFLKSKPIYEILLNQLLKKNPNMANISGTENKVILEIQISLGSQISNKKICEVSWPEDILIVGIKRGENELIPKGNTELQPNDYLMILTDLDKAGYVNKEVIEMAKESQ